MPSTLFVANGVVYPEQPNTQVELPKMTKGYWEPHSSSIDFCEDNYLHTKFLVETHNTWSSIVGISLLGIVGLVLGNSTRERRHTMTYILLVLIGVGSAGLHGTLHWAFQSSDELPMIYLATLANYMCIEYASPMGKPKYPQLPLGLILLMVAVTFIYYCFQHIFLVFVFMYSVAEIVNVYLMYTILYGRKDTSEAARRIGKLALYSYLIVALPIWHFDMYMCQWILANIATIFNGATMHVVWHLSAGFGAYCAIVCLECCRMDALELPYQEYYVFGLIPVILATQKEKKSD